MRAETRAIAFSPQPANIFGTVPLLFHTPEFVEENYRALCCEGIDESWIPEAHVATVVYKHEKRDILVGPIQRKARRLPLASMYSVSVCWEDMTMSDGNGASALGLEI